MRFLAGLAAAFVAIACTDAALAQTIGNKLRGILVFHLVTEVDQECGVTRDIVRKAVQTAVRDAGARLTNDVHAIDIFVYSWTASTSNVCATTLQLQVAWTQLIDIPKKIGSAGHVPAEVMAWRDATMFTSHSVGHAKRVRDAITKMAGRFADDWRRDNR